jgi:ribosomal-protein-alanine N-acetyltransferase
MTEMLTLHTKHLIIRPFIMEDLADIHQLLDIELKEDDTGSEKMETLEERTEWLQWSVLNYKQLAKLNQPPYGDRTIVHMQTAQLIGTCGFVPCLNAFEQCPNFSYYKTTSGPGQYTAEFGLYYAISPNHQRQGYAAEAAQAMVDYAFNQLQLKRIIATASYDNSASIGVMRKLGMRVESNPLKEPPWLQVVGVIENNR